MSSKAVAHDSTVDHEQTARRFLSQNWILLASASLLAVSAFGYELFNFTLSIDEELKTFDDAGIGWVKQGRWGTFVLTSLIMPHSLIPFLPTFIAVVFLVVSSLLLAEVVGGNMSSKVILSSWLVTFPSTAYFMEFNTFNFAVSIGIAASIAGVLLLKKYHEGTQQIVLWVGAILLTMFSIGAYQGIACVWICCVMLHVVSHRLTRPSDEGRYVGRFLLSSSGVLAIAVAGYTFIDLTAKRVLGAAGDTYLDRFIGWGSRRPKTTIRVLAQYGQEHLLGREFYGEDTILILWLVMPALLFHVVRRNGLRRGVVTLGALALLLVSPFTLVIALGSPLPVRSLVAMPFMIGGLCYLFAISSSRRVRNGMLVATILIAVHHSFAITTLYYSDQLVRAADQELARGVMDRVLTLDIDLGGTRGLPVAFIGKRLDDGNGVIVRSETFGASFFDFGGPNQERIHAFLWILGFRNLVVPSAAEFEVAMRESSSMKNWPHRDSVRNTGQMVVVKLSNPTPRQVSGQTH